MNEQLPSKYLSSVLIDAAQLMHGWKQADPHEWSEWDDNVLTRVREQIQHLEAAKRVTQSDLAKTIDARASHEPPDEDIESAEPLASYLEDRIRTHADDRTIDISMGRANMILQALRDLQQFHDWARPQITDLNRASQPPGVLTPRFQVGDKAKLGPNGAELDIVDVSFCYTIGVAGHVVATGIREAELQRATPTKEVKP